MLKEPIDFIALADLIIYFFGGIWVAHRTGEYVVERRNLPLILGRPGWVVVFAILIAIVIKAKVFVYQIFFKT